MKQLSLCMAAASLACAACGGGSSNEGDVDADVIPDTHVETDAADVPEEDAAEDPPDDTGSDADADPTEDTTDVVDTVEIVDAVDTPPDTTDVIDTVEIVDAVEVPPDTTDAVDAPDTPPDVPADGTCLPMEASISAVDSWVICFMGTGTHVSFTIDYENNSTGCDYTAITVTGGSLRLTSTDVAIMTFGTTPPTTTFGGTVPASTTASVGYHASDTTLDTRSYDGQSVYVEVQISYSTPYTSSTLTVTSSDTTHTCVY